MSLRITAALAMLAAGLVLVTGAGAGTRSVPAPKALDLSSVGAIKSYLRSIGVNPRSVVIQRGKRNYAGPSCPGKGWTCTTRTRALQIGAVNSYECTGGTGTNNGTQTCTGPGVQVGDKNTFRCIEKTSIDPAVQHCSATQTGPSNYALVQQVADLGGSNPDQDATQTANINQSGSGKNEVHIHQTIRESTTATETTTQDGHQVAIVTQKATETAKNFSDVHQYMDLRASGGTNQSQNEGFISEAGVTDCASGPESPAEPNQCANIDQTADAGGSNLQHLHQLIDEDEKSSTATNQDQGQVSGGTDSEVHQEVLAPPSLLITVADGGGSSESHANQARRQNVSGPPRDLGYQDQIDPTRCCGVTQVGGRHNVMKINQAGSQRSNQGAEQVLTLIGECNTTNGTCTATHHARNDDAHASFSDSCGSTEDPCPFTLITVCESEEAFEGGGTGECAPPEDSIVVPDSFFTATSLLPGTPLSGFEVTMGLVAPVLQVLP